MVTLSSITARQRADCVGFAVQLAQTAVGDGSGYVSPNARIGTLSVWEWDKIVMGAISGWVAERSRQVGERFWDEEYLLATGQVPEPYELGLASHVLPALGDLIEKMGLSDKPIGEWSRNDVCLFVWTCADMFSELRARNDERPTDGADPSDILAGG